MVMIFFRRGTPTTNPNYEISILPERASKSCIPFLLRLGNLNLRRTTSTNWPWIFYGMRWSLEAVEPSKLSVFQPSEIHMKRANVICLGVVEPSKLSFLSTWWDTMKSGILLEIMALLINDRKIQIIGNRAKEVWWMHQLIDLWRTWATRKHHHFELVCEWSDKWSDNLMQHISCENERLDWSMDE